MRNWHTTEIIRIPSNCEQAHKKLSDKRPFNDIRRDDGYWNGFREAVKAGCLPEPVVMPIRRAS